MNLEAVKEYLGPDTQWSDSDIQSALDAEAAAQAKRVTYPDPVPADLDEALCRRVAHNLALRPLPLGLATSISEISVATNNVGGLDAEVRRLESPYRRVVIA